MVNGTGLQLTAIYDVMHVRGNKLETRDARRSHRPGRTPPAFVLFCHNSGAGSQPAKPRFADIGRGEGDLQRLGWCASGCNVALNVETSLSKFVGIDVMAGLVPAIHACFVARA